MLGRTRSEVAPSFRIVGRVPAFASANKKPDVSATIVNVGFLRPAVAGLRNPTYELFLLMYSHSSCAYALIREMAEPLWILPYRWLLYGFIQCHSLVCPFPYRSVY